MKYSTKLYIELFKRGVYDTFATIDGKVNTKQIQALSYLNDRVTRELLFGGAKGGGKIVKNDGYVLGPFGFIKGENLKVGMLINNPDGSIQKIIQIKPEVKLPLWRVWFNDNTFTDVAEDHLWLAWKSTQTRKINKIRTSGKNSGEVVETKTLKEWIEKKYKPQIPVCENQPFNVFSNEKNKINPYLLGLLLGDGCITNNNLSISCHKDDMSHYVNKIGDNCLTQESGCIRIIGERKIQIKNKLKNYGIDGLNSKNKRIPDRYKYGTIEDRYLLINGLMDTDGYKPKDKNGAYYYTISQTLANDIAFVLRSLGSVVTITKDIGKYKKNGMDVICNECYNLYIKHRHPDLLFSLPRKKSLRLEHDISKGVVKVEKTNEEVTGRCITVSNPNGLYITNDFIVTHNSYLGATNQVMNCVIYDGVKYFIAREELNDLRKWTVPTINEVCENLGIEKKDYKFNGQDNYFEFFNDSKIYLLPAKKVPSDPFFERFGSMQNTGGWIEEGGEIHEMAYSNLKLSIGRWKNKEYNIPFKLLITANPKKNWMYTNIIKPLEKGTLSDKIKYIQSFAADNHGLSNEYLETLNGITDKRDKQRLLMGIWDYDDDDLSLVSYNKILDMFTNSFVQSGQRFLTMDLAITNDRFVCVAWDGLRIVEIRSIKNVAKPVNTLDENNEWINKIDLSPLVKNINELCNNWVIPRSNISYDADGGLGAKMRNIIPGAVPINNGRKSINLGFKNLSTELGYKLADCINENMIYFDCHIDSDVKEDIKNEIQLSLKRNSEVGKDLSLISKADVKSLNAQKSPDHYDAIKYRMLFLLTRNS